MPKYEPDKDYYLMLGVEEQATKAEIDRAYRIQARKLHPDGGGNEEEMKSLNEARDVLGNAEARKLYDAGRQEYEQKQQPRSAAYGSSMAYDPEAASRAGTLNIPVADEDFVGLCMGAATCFVLGLPFLVLIETQWVFFLWPLRVLTLGAILLGVFLAHSALGVKHREMRKSKPKISRSRIVFDEVAFWTVGVGTLASLLFLLYGGMRLM
jgi:DnaJ-like protein